MDIISIGEILIDFTPGNQPLNYTANPGGAPANVAIAAARNGLEVGFIGTMGKDDFGKLLKTTLEKDQVNVLCPKLLEEATTTLAFVTLYENGERSFTFARKPGADMLLGVADIHRLKDELQAAHLINAGSFSLSSASAAAAISEAMQIAKDNHHLVAFDINYRDSVWNSQADCLQEVTKLLPSIDFLKISDEELFFVGGEENIPNFMKKNNITIVIETLGSKGAKYFYNAKEVLSDTIPGLSVQAVDATGAGDAFWGGFLSKLLMQGIKTTADVTESAIVSALTYGNVSGGLCVQKAGGIPAIPTKEQIEQKFLEQ